MPGKTQLFVLLLMAGIHLQQQAQQPSRNSFEIEDLLYRNESALIPESDTIFIDLNRASQEELEASELFSAYQIHNLLKYRDTFGPLYSIHELIPLPGFHPSGIQKIQAHLVLGFGPVTEEKFRGKHMVLLDMVRSFPTENDYHTDPGSEVEPRYAGSPLATCIRIRSQPWRRLSMACTYEKDAGELFLYRNRPQFLSAYLNYQGKGFFKQVVAGNFQLNQGLGLVNGSGFIHGAANFPVNQLSLSRIKPYASKTESMYEQGMACRMGTKHIRILGWASYKKISLSPSVITENQGIDKWQDNQRTSGLYRTLSELEGRELAYRMNAGIQVLYMQKNLALGVLHNCQWLGPGKKALDLLIEDPEPYLSQRISMHGNWSKKRFQVFGEFSSSQYQSIAFLIGSQYHVNDFIQCSLLIHHYGVNYQGSLPSSYSSGSKLNNEQGLAFHLQVETGKLITAKITGELFRYPMPRYLTQVPSAGYRMDLSLQNPGRRVMEWRARWVCKTWQTTPAANSYRIRPLQEHRVNRFDVQLIYNHLARFKWQNRLVVGYYTQNGKTIPGYAAVQQLSLNISQLLKASTQFVLFHVSDWENRIYLHEPGFYYSFNFPAYYGCGQKASLLITIKPGSGISISAKFSGTFNTGNKKWDTGLQLRLNL